VKETGATDPMTETSLSNELTYALLMPRLGLCSVHGIEIDSRKGTAIRTPANGATDPEDRNLPIQGNT